VNGCSETRLRQAVEIFGRMTRGKRHFHFVLDSVTRGETKRGNPETYWFLLDCGHFKIGRHGPHYAVSHFATQVLKAEKDVSKKIRMHCDYCAAEKPHDERILRVWRKVGIQVALTTSIELIKAEVRKLKMPECRLTGAYMGAMLIGYCHRCEQDRDCHKILHEYLSKAR